MTMKRCPPAVVDLPSPCDIVITREFDAPIARVFAVCTTRARAEAAAADGETLQECTIDLRVGGRYRTVFAGEDGSTASFNGTFLEVERPTRVVATYVYDGWPDVEAMESFGLQETAGGTALTYRLTFPDQGSRDRIRRYDGLLASIDHIEDRLIAGLGPPGTVSP